MAKYQTANITGVAYWAAVQAPNTTFEPVWTIDVCQLEDKTKAALEQLGLGDKIKNKDDDRGDFITIKQKTHGKNGNEFKAPTVKDADNRPFDGLIGNGSKVAVQFAIRPWEYAGKKGTAADLRQVQVLELVEYAGSDNDDDVVDLDNLPLTAAG